MIALFWLADAFAQGSTVTVPLDVWERTKPVPLADPTFAIGAARYRGEASPDDMILDLHLTLDVSLSGDGRKLVPLLGGDVALARVTVGGQPVPVTAVDGHHVWSTDQKGTFQVEIDAHLPPVGQGGSVEYAATVVQTPITSVDLVFPRPDLQPEIRGATAREITAMDGKTHVHADLGPTNALGIVGLRAFGSEKGETARMYAETRHLVAVDERELDLFTVVRYSILYAPAQHFEVFLPEGLEVVSADGEGAFAWEIEPAPGGQLLRGETSFPMRNRYELSLQLSRPLPDADTRIVLPAVRGVEREHGWVGIEAPGRVRLSEAKGEDLVPVDVHQLPDELKRASVSPLLQGFRTSGEGALQLSVTALPEVEATAERIDRIDARTVVSEQGRAMTELSLTLRNRLRPGLALTLPEGAEIVRTLRDGAPVAPSQASTGEIIVPLRRSAPDAPYTVQIVLSHDLGALSLFGKESLSLPLLDWPTTAISWEISLPPGHSYSDLSSAVPSQGVSGYGRWLADERALSGEAPPAAPQIIAPSTSTSLRYERYWVPAQEPLSVSFWHYRPLLGWLVVPLLGMLGLSFLAFAIRQGFSR